ncbi:hypothetical protein BGZ65_009499 [Modicella reniformis]|uniref:Pentatricopeptide repeat-containing protein n=1 Tax=Modicella reniformis TaxID=1440133 RepID=A0A9P6MBP9_9FUNG|nr:hypothetical protein BGZ65_009499 [Modicella reniformis]
MLQDWREALRVLENWAAANPQGGPPFEVTSDILKYELSGWLIILMKRLVYSHTNLIRTMLGTIPQRFGVPATVDMYLVGLLCSDACKITVFMLSVVVEWKHEPAVYHHLLHSLRHTSGNQDQADKIIEEMLANNLVPRMEAMKAAITCAAHSGDLESCSRYINRMDQEWNLTITDRLKAILLYACTKRRDFDGTLEVLAQFSHSERLVHPSLDARLRRRSRDSDPVSASSSSVTFADVQELLSAQDVVDKSNILLALINQTQARRGRKKRLSHEFIEEVSKVLELFTIITKDSKQVDTQLYTIMVQYLSKMPSPLPGMMYLYKEMRELGNVNPNCVTYRIILDACAEQIDMDQAKQLWEDMSVSNIPQDCHTRASYVKGWGRAGHLETAERIAKEGLLAQEILERVRRRHQIALVVKGKQRRDHSLSMLLKPGRQPRQQQTLDMIDLNVLHELMKAHRAHDKPERVYELYQEVEVGKWGSKIRPNEYSLSIVLGACGSSSATSELVDMSIGLVDQYLQKQRRRHVRLQGDETTLYYIMLGRHHRQRKMVEVWDDMMQWIKRPPSHLTVKFTTEALENVQWGAAPIKRIRWQLRENWPDVEWSTSGRRRRRGSNGNALGSFGFAYDSTDEDESVGPGGRFWR